MATEREDWVEKAANEICHQVEFNSLFSVQKDGRDTFKLNVMIPQWLVYDIIEKHAPAASEAGQ